MRNALLRSALLGFAAAVSLITPSPVAAQITALGPSTLAPSGVLGSFDYDDKHHVYLHAWEYQNRVWGRFIGSDGAVLGLSFVVSTAVAPSGFAGRPRVAYTRGSSADEFVVMYASDVNSVNRASNIFGQVVRYTGSGPTAGSMDPGYITLSPFFADSTLLQILDAVVFNPTTSRFLIVWEEAPSGQYEVLARHIAIDGAPVGSTWNVSQSAGSQGIAAAAFDPSSNRYLIAYAGDGGPGFPALGAFARILDGSTAQPVSGVILLAGGYNTEPAVTYLPARAGFLATWTGFKPDRTVMAEFVPSSYPSAMTDAPFLALDTAGNDGAASIMFDPSSHYTVVAAMSDPKYIRGSLLDANGAPQVPPFVLGTSPAVSGSYYPTAKPAEGGIFGLIYVTDYSSAVFERFQLGGVVTPPPPPPLCTYSLNSAGTTVASAGGVGYVTVIASAPGCTWSASSNAGWVGVAPTSGTGTITLTFSIAPNPTAANRSGTLTIAGQTFTIVEGGAPVSGAAIHDMNGDRLSDLMWQHQTTGDLVAWYLNGATVAGWNYLSISRVADTNWKVVGTGDLDGDGYADLVWQHSSGYLGCWMLRGSTVVATSNLSINPVSDTNWKIRAVSDVNGDGKADLIWQNDATGGLIVWFMNGNTVTSWSFLSIPAFTDPNWKIAAGGDLNGDGKGDIVWHNQVTGEVVAWMLDGATVTGTAYLSIGAVSDTAWTVRGAGDVNGDGRADIIWQNTTTGGLVVWFMNGYQVVSWSYLSIPSVADTNWHVVGPG